MRLGSSDYWAYENGGTVTVWVDRGNDVETSPFTVNYATSGGTATAGADYTATSGTLTFGVGEQSKAITIPILNDGLRELEESFQLTLSQVSGGVSLGSPTAATIRIGHNDPGANFKAGGWEVREAAGTAELTVVRGNDVDLGPMRVDYVLVDHTARAGLDYTAGSGRLEFGQGETEKTFSVTVLEELR